MSDALLESLQARLDARGLEGATVIEYGAQPLLAHLACHGAVPVNPWLEALERYVERIGHPGRSVWSATRFVIPPLLEAAGADLSELPRLLALAGDALAEQAESRLEQTALRVAGHALADRPRCLALVLAGCPTLERGGIDAGWLVQLVVPPLARAAPDHDAFGIAWTKLLDFAVSVQAAGVDVGFPVATALAALIERNQPSHLDAWLTCLAPLARTAGRSAYGLFEHGVARLAQGSLSADAVTEALGVALTLLDHGVAPGPTLAALETPHGLGLELEIAGRLADAGVDPSLVIANGVPIFEALGWLADDGERLIRLAVNLHSRGLRTLLFEDGIQVLLPLDHDYGGLALFALELIEAMVARGLEPGVLMRWSLPRTLRWLQPPWAPSELLGFARALVDADLAPEAAVGWAARPLVEISRNEAEFRRLSKAVVALAARLQHLGVDHREVLFHDVGSLAESGGESHAFTELLDGLASLLHGWTAAGLDPTELLGSALPAAAREAAGRPWLLHAALRQAARLGAEGRAAAALTLLSVGVHTLATLGVAEGTATDRALTCLERRLTALPSPLAGPAARAATAVAGTNTELLDAALGAIGNALARHGEAVLALAPALPALARTGRDVRGLARLIEAAAGLGGGAWLPAVAEVVGQACRSADEGEQALPALAAWVTAAPGRAATLARFAPLAAIVSPGGLVRSAGLVHDALATAGEAQRSLLELLAEARTENELASMCQVVPPLLPSLLRGGLDDAKELVRRHSRAWTRLVQPALLAAKQRAEPLLSALVSLCSRAFDSDESIEVLRTLITQRGVKAVDLLTSLVAPALARGIIPSLGQHRELLQRYLDEVGFVDAFVYADFVAIMRDCEPAGLPRRVAELREQISALADAIRAGEVTPEQRSHRLFAVALQHVFPAAVSATRRNWELLVDRMPDRPEDVTALFHDGHRAALALATGSWQLEPDAQGLEVFGWWAQVMPQSEGDEGPATPLEEIGWSLLAAWSEGRLARAPHKQELTRELLRHIPPESLPPAAADSAPRLLAIKQLAADRLAALVESAILAARETDAGRVERLVRAKLAPAPRIGSGLVKAVRSILADEARGTIPAEEACRRLGGQLRAFEPLEDVLGTLKRTADLRAALRALAPRHVEIEPGKEISRVHAELVGQELREMEAVLSEALEYRELSDQVELEVTVTKRAVHAPIGLTSGVCVAGDRKLWETPGFMHLALWHEGVCAGGVHLLVVSEGEERFLALPGINPTSRLLARVDAAALLNALLVEAKRLAKKAGLSGVWIPANRTIHSNRRAVSEALAALRLPLRRTAGHSFSFKPFAYRIDDVLEYWRARRAV